MDIRKLTPLPYFTSIVLMDLSWHPIDAIGRWDLFDAYRRTANLSFQEGTTEFYWPVSGIGGIESLYELDRNLDRVKSERHEIIAVDVMDLCPTGSDPATSVVNPDGN